MSDYSQFQRDRIEAARRHDAEQAFLAVAQPAPSDEQIRWHELKTDPDVFDAVARGAKTHEIRRNDRNFKVGDGLLLRRTRDTGWTMRNTEAPLVYTGQECRRIVSHVLSGYGLQDGWVILSFAPHLAAPAAPSDRQINELAFQHGLVPEGYWSEDAIAFGRELLSAAPAAQPADSAMEVPDIGMVCPTAPERIWLQVDPEPQDEGKPVYPESPSRDDVSWCWDKINVSDTLYIRADLARALIAMTDDQIEEIAHRKAWRYKHSSDPAHSHTYTFNRAQLLEFARTLNAASNKDRQHG